MNLYLISQDANYNWNTYNSAVVAAESEQDAINIGPKEGMDEAFKLECWVADKHVKVKLIGKADESIHRGVICAAFDAG